MNINSTISSVFIFKSYLILVLLVSLKQIKILQATGLPQYLSNFVFCQYSFWDQADPIIVAPEVDPSASFSSSKDPLCMVVFDSCKVRVKTCFYNQMVN